MLDELPALIAPGTSRCAEEDIVRLKWWGLYHDKPKIGTFMLRVKIPGGIISPRAAARDRRDLERARPRRGRADDAPERAAALHRARRAPGRVRSPARASASRRPARAATRCATSPAARSPVSPTTSSSTRRRCSTKRPSSSTATRTTPTCRASTRSRSPRAPTRARRRRSTASALIGAIRDGEEGFGVLVGGGLSSVPRIARELGIWVPKDEAVDGARRDPRRVARRPALPRLARQGAAQVHDRRHRPGGHARARRAAARPHVRRLHAAAAAAGRATTSASHEQRDGRFYVGVPVHLGLSPATR